MKGNDFVFDSVDLLYYKLHEISLIRSGSYIDSPIWLKNKKEIINHKIMMTNAFNMQPSHKNGWKKIETNNETIAFNILYVPYVLK